MLGAVNSASWNGYAPDTWLCVDINTRSVRTETGIRYLTRYEFAYKPEKWTYDFRTFHFNNLSIGSITAYVKSTGSFDRFRRVAFDTFVF